MAYKASDEIKKFIKGEEKLKLKAYDDYGKTSVGWGIRGTGKKTVTKAEADKMFDDRMKVAERDVNKVITNKNLTQGQIDVIFDMHFNGGAGMIEENAARINAGDLAAVEESLDKYIHATDPKTKKKVVVDALVDRAAKRKEMWRRATPKVAADKPAAITPKTTATVRPVAPVKKTVDVAVPTMNLDLNNMKTAVRDTKEPAVMETAVGDTNKPAEFVDMNGEVDETSGVVQAAPVAPIAVAKAAPVESEVVSAPAVAAAPDPLLAELDAFDQGQVQMEEVNPDTELLAELNDFESHEADGKVPMIQSEEDLKVSSDAAPALDTPEILEAQAIAKETGAPFPLVMGMFSEGYKAKEIRAKAHIGDLARHYPAATKWASKPENFAVLQEVGPEWIKTITNTAKDINEDDSNVERAFDSGLLTLAEVATVLSFNLGTLTAEEAEDRFEALDKEKQARGIKDQDVDLLRKSWGEYVKGDKGTLWDQVVYAAGKPKALGLQSIESAITSAIPFTASLTGIVFPATFPYAFGTAFASGGAIAFGTKFREQMEQFRDPKTGKLDLNKHLADKDAVARWRNEAAVYGAVMGTFDAAFGVVAGKFFPFLGKAGSKLAGKAGEKVGKAVGAVAEVASGPLSEGMSETVATTAGDAYAGRLTKEKWEENKRAGMLEGALSIPLEGTFGPIAYGARQLAPVGELKAKKTVDLATEGVKAVKAGAAMSKLRAQLGAQNGKYNEEIKGLFDLINEVDPQNEQPTAQGDEDTFDNIEEKSETREKEKEMNDKAHKGYVHISPSEWKDFFLSRDKDPYTMIQFFGSEIHAEFMASEDSDASVAIPFAEWATLAAHDPEVDMIARFQKNKFNAKEGDELMREMDEDPTMMYEPGEFDLFSKTPDASGEPEAAPIPMTIIEATKAEGNAILRPVDLVGKFNSDEEKRVFGGLKKKLTKISKELNLEKEGTDAFSDVQFMRLKHRAAVMGREIGELYDNTTISVYNNPDAEHMGFFATNRIIGEKTKLSFNKGIENHIDVVIHEFGHSWLHELAEDYHYIKAINPDGMTEAQRVYSESMDKVAELLGLKNIQELLNLDAPTYRKLHETFAQTTELYFLEGKYANSKIKAVMETFRNWIVDTLNYIKMMTNKYPTLKITPEVERMFEGILGTSKRIEEEVIPMFSVQQYPDSFLGPYAQKFKDAMADVQTEAVGETYFKSFKGTMREQEAIIKKAMNRITDEAISDVDNLESMQFLKSMEAAHMDYKSGGISLDPRLSYESVMSELLGGNEADTAWLKDKLPTAVMTGKKKGGIDVRDYMLQAQITNPSVLLDLLIQTTKREQMIDARIKEKIKNEFPVTKTDEEIHEIAVEAVNGVAKERYLMMELDLFAEKHMTAYKNMASKLMEPPTGRDKITKEILELEAHDLVMDASAKVFSPDKFLRDSQRLARQAAKAFKKNDIVAAFNAKKREVVLFMAYREAKAAAKYLRYANQTSNMILKYAPTRAVMNKMDTDVLKFGYHLVDAVRKGNPLPKFSDIKISEFSGVTAQHHLILEVRRNALVEIMQSRQGKNISVEAAIHYAELLKSIMFVAHKAKNIELGGKQVLLADAEKMILDSVPESGPVVSYAKSWFMSASRRRVSNHKVSTGLASLYSDQKAFASSVLGEKMGNVRDGEAKVGLVLSDAEARLHDRFKAISKSGKPSKDDKDYKGDAKTKIKRFKESVFAPLKRLTDTHPVLAPELEFTFENEGQMLMALATALGSESGLMRFLSSKNKFTGKPFAEFNPTTGEVDSTGLNNFVNRMIKEKKLRKEHFELFQTIWDIFAERHPGVKKVMRYTDGVEMGHIAGKRFTNEFGEWSGGYVPVSEVGGIDKEMIRAGLMDVDSEGMNFSKLYPIQATGMLKQRQAVSVDELDLDMRKILSYVSNAAKIEHLRIPMMDIGNILKRPQVAARIEQRRPDFIKNVLTSWFDYTVNQMYTDPDKHLVHALAGKFRKNANTVMYLGSLGTPIRQFYGLAPGAQRVGAKNLSRSLAKMAGMKGLRETMGHAQSKSVFLRERFQGGMKKYVKSANLIDTNFDWWSQMSDKKEFLTYVLSQATQNIVDVAIWDAAYFNAIEDGTNENAAVRFANSAVADTQGSPNVSDMPLIQRGTNIEKLLTMVTSVPLAMNNMIAEEMMRVPDKVITKDGEDISIEDRKAKLKVMGSMGFVMLAIPFLLESGIGELGDDDDEDKDTEDKLKTMGMKTLAGGLDTWMPVWSRAITGAMTYSNPSVSPALSKLTNAARVPTIIGNSMDGVDMSAKEMALMLESFTLISGIPTSVAGRPIRFVDNQKDSSDKKPLLRRRRRQLRVARRGK